MRSLPLPLAALMTRTRRLAHDESGNVIVYVSVAAALLLGMVGLALDSSRALITHSEAQAAADAAALAGASQLDGRTDACTRAQSEAVGTVVANQQRFASGGPGSITIQASGTDGPKCLNDLPGPATGGNDSTAIPSTMVTSDGTVSRYIQVTTQQLTHQNTLLAALSGQNTVTIQRSAVAGFRRSLCAASPVMSVCSTFTWQPGVAFDAWNQLTNPFMGWVNDPSCGNGATCTHDTLAANQPAICVADSSVQLVGGNRTNQAADGINTRFGQGSSLSQPSDVDITDFTQASPTTGNSYSNDLNGGTGWNCYQYFQDFHKTDGLSPPASCSTNETTTTRYSVYESERASLSTIPTPGPSGLTSTGERRLLYLAIFDCSNSGSPAQAFLKAFMLAPAVGGSVKRVYVEPLSLVTSKTDPTVIHEEVQLYR